MENLFKVDKTDIRVVGSFLLYNYTTIAVNVSTDSVFHNDSY